MPEVGVLFEDMSGFDLVLRPLEFLLRWWISLEAFDFSMEGILDHFRLLARAHESIEVEKARVGLKQAVLCSDGKRKFLLVHETLIEARAFPVRENGTQNVERVRIVARIIRHAIARHDEGDLRISLEEKAAFTFLLRLHGGEAAMLTSIIERFAASGVEARAAIADTWGVAHAAARFLRRQIAVIPPGETEPMLRLLPLAALRLHSRIPVDGYRWRLDPFGEPTEMEAVEVRVNVSGLGLGREAEFELSVEHPDVRLSLEPGLVDRRGAGS